MANLFEHNAATSHAEVIEHEELMSAKRIMVLPTNQQILIENDVNTDPIYVGYAPKDLAEGTDGWVIYSISYSSRNPVAKKTAYGNWTNRASEVYG